MQHEKWVFVTGGTRGIGRGIVERLTDEGYDVAFTYKSSREKADEIVNAAVPGKGTRLGVACDVSNEAEVFALAGELVKKRGAPYAVVNNAGIVRDKLFVSMDFREWGSVVANNLDSAFLVNRAFLPHMIRVGDGCILHMSSVTAFRGNVGQSSYASTKAAVLGMIRTLAHEVGRFNLRVNAIAPGLISTDMTAAIPELQLKRFLKQVALRRTGNVEDVATLVSFLLGPGGRYITGQTLVVDGGLSV